MAVKIRIRKRNNFQTTRHRFSVVAAEAGV